MYDADRGYFGCSMEYPYRYSIFTDDCDHGGESMEGSYIVTYKVHVNKFSLLTVTGLNFCDLGTSCHFLYVAGCTWCFVYFLRKVFL